MKEQTTFSALFIALFFSASSAVANAEEPAPEEPRSPITVDVEIDPIAYALGGYSVHGGIGWRRFRLDLGAFGMELPAWVHGNEGFSTSFGGYGLKGQYFLIEEQKGPFVGISAGVLLPLISLDGTELASSHRQFNLGLQAGWRIDLGARFFVTPWIGVDYNLGAPEVTLMDQTYEHPQWTFFPTIHLGYRSR